MSDIDVAVVIVSYKSAAVAVECLGSLNAERADPRQRLRVILVDNDSGDISEIR